MKLQVLLAVGALGLLATSFPAFAQGASYSSSNSTGVGQAAISNSGNIANGSSNASSRSVGLAQVQVNNYSDPPPTDPPTDPAGDPLGSAANPYTTNTNVSGTTHSDIYTSGTTTVRNVPDVVAPSVYAGTNPCAVGGSAAGAGPGIGISFGITTSSHECVQRAWYVLMMQSAAAAGKAGNTALAAQDIQWARNIACNQISSEAPAGVCVPAHGKVAEQAAYRTVSNVPLPTRTIRTVPNAQAAAVAVASKPAEQVVAAPMHLTTVAQRTDPDWCKRAIITNSTTRPDVLYIHKMCGPNVPDTRNH